MKNGTKLTTRASVAVPLGRDRKIRTALRTTKIARFVTVQKKQTITVVLSGKVFGKKRVRSASGDLDRYCG